MKLNLSEPSLCVAVHGALACTLLSSAGCGIRAPKEAPSCESDAWIDAVARAECERHHLCSPDSDAYPSFAACLEHHVSEIQSSIESQHTWDLGEAVTGACTHEIDCSYPLHVEDSCSRPLPEWEVEWCLD